METSGYVADGDGDDDDRNGEVKVSGDSDGRDDDDGVVVCGGGGGGVKSSGTVFFFFFSTASCQVFHDDYCSHSTSRPSLSLSPFPQFSPSLTPTPPLLPRLYSENLPRTPYHFLVMCIYL